MRPAKGTGDVFNLLVATVGICYKISRESFQKILCNVSVTRTGIIEECRSDLFVCRTPNHPHERLAAGFFSVFLVTLDTRFIHMQDGTTAILECKTAHYDTQYLWANDAVPRHYEMQVRHYMSVMNIDVAYIACLFSNSEKDFVWRKIERDLDEEENTIMLLQDFWTRYVCNRVEPPLNEKPDMVLDVLRRFYCPADTTAPCVSLASSFVPTLEQLLVMKAEKSDLDSRVRKLDAQIKAAYAPIAELMGPSCRATCVDSGVTYNVTFNAQCREGISKDKLSALKAQHPDIYDEFIETTEWRTFKLTKSQN